MEDALVARLVTPNRRSAVALEHLETFMRDQVAAGWVQSACTAGAAGLSLVDRPRRAYPGSPDSVRDCSDCRAPGRAGTSSLVKRDMCT